MGERITDIKVSYREGTIWLVTIVCSAKGELMNRYQLLAQPKAGIPTLTPGALMWVMVNPIRGRDSHSAQDYPKLGNI